jgi:hypothetical protein
VNPVLVNPVLVNREAAAPPIEGKRRKKRKEF